MEERRENIMGTQPINRLLPSMAFPIMLSMLVQALWLTWCGQRVRLTERKRTDQREPGLSGAEPDDRGVCGTAVGINALLSRRLGEKI